MILTQSEIEKYLEVAEVVFVVINADQTVRYINRKGCEILGYSDQDIIGKNWFNNFISEKERERVKEVFNKLIAGDIGNVEHFENTVINKNGEERLISWHNTVLKNDEDNIVNTLASGEDITEKRKIENELILKVKELEKINRLMVDRELKMAELKKNCKI